MLSLFSTLVQSEKLALSGCNPQVCPKVTLVKGD